jgi:hypothetical protein
MANSGGGYDVSLANDNWRLTIQTEQVAHSGRPGSAQARPSPTGTLDTKGDQTDLQQAPGLTIVNVRGQSVTLEPLPATSSLDIAYVQDKTQQGQPTPIGRLVDSMVMGDFVDLRAGF